MDGNGTPRCCDAEFGGAPCAACAEMNIRMWMLVGLFSALDVGLVTLWVWVL